MPACPSHSLNFDRVEIAPPVWKAFFRRELTSTDLRLAWLIDQVSKASGGACDWTNAQLAEEVGGSSHHISDSISKLSKLNYIRVYFRNGQERLILPT